MATLAPSFGGEWCENFETDSGTFWRQEEYQGGAWLHTTYSDETAQGHDVPKPPTGEVRSANDSDTAPHQNRNSKTGKTKYDFLYLYFDLADEAGGYRRDHSRV